MSHQAMPGKASEPALPSTTISPRAIWAGGLLVIAAVLLTLVSGWRQGLLLLIGGAWVWCFITPPSASPRHGECSSQIAVVVACALRC